MNFGNDAARFDYLGTKFLYMYSRSYHSPARSLLAALVQTASHPRSISARSAPPRAILRVCPPRLGGGGLPLDKISGFSRPGLFE